MQFVIMLPMIMAAAALAVDGSAFYAARSSAQAVADAATLAASSALLEGGEYTLAVSRAEQTVDANPMFGGGFTLPRDGVEFGVWDFDRGAFSARAPSAANVNAVRVRVRSAPVEPIFSSLVGLRAPSAESSAVAVAISGADSTAGCGMLSDGTYDVHGNPKMDSYELAKGAYNTVTNIGRNGNSCSNGDYVVRGHVDIWGTIGYGGSFTERGGAASYDALYPMSSDVEVEEVDCSDARANNDNASLTITRTHGRNTSEDPAIDASGAFDARNGDVVTFGAGVYYMTEFNVKAQVDIIVSGEAVICVDGDVDFRARSFTNTSLDPRNFVVQVDSTGGPGSSGDVVFHANTATHAVVQAPASEIDFNGNADFFGIVIGHDISHQGNAEVHVPEELAGEYAPMPSISAVRLVQ